MNTDDAIRKVAERVNQKRRSEILNIYSSTDIFKQLKQLKDQETFRHGSKSKTWRKVASFPIEIDQFFTKVYGPDYYKDKNFFTRFAPEWLVVHEKHL